MKPEPAKAVSGLGMLECLGQLSALILCLVPGVRVVSRGMATPDSGESQGLAAWSMSLPEP